MDALDQRDEDGRCAPSSARTRGELAAEETDDAGDAPAVTTTTTRTRKTTWTGREAEEDDVDGHGPFHRSRRRRSGVSTRLRALGVPTRAGRARAPNQDAGGASAKERALDEKTWLLKGEASAKERPKNSVLEADVEFDHVAAPPPAVSEEMTARLEDVIKARVAEQRFDDVERVEPSTRDDRGRRTPTELDDVKSKKGLGDIYADDYAAQKHLAKTGARLDEEKEDPVAVEARALFAALAVKLDALSNFNFAPKPVVQEMQIKTDAPALQVGGSAAGGVRRGAPGAGGGVCRRRGRGGARGSAAGDVKADAELTKEDRKAARAKRKRKAKAVGNERERAKAKREREKEAKEKAAEDAGFTRKAPKVAMLAAAGGRAVQVGVLQVLQGFRDAPGGQGCGREGPGQAQEKRRDEEQGVAQAVRRGEAPRHKRGGLFFTHEKRRTRKFEKFGLTATVRFTTSRDTRASRGAASRGVIARERRRARAACLHGRVFPGFHGARGPQGALVAELLSLGSLALVLRGESENDEPVDAAPATTPRRPTPARSRAAIPRRGSRRLTAALLSWQRSVAVPESLFSELEGKRRRDGSRKAHAAPRFVAAPDSWLALAFTATGFVLTLTHVAPPDARVRRLRRPHAPGSPRGAVALDRRRGLGRRSLFPRKPARELPHGRLVLEPDARPRRRGARPVEHRARVRQVGRVRVRCHGAAAARRAVRLVDMARARRRRNRGRGSARLRLIRLFRLFHLARLGRASGGAIVGDAEALLARGTLFPLAIWLAQTACEFVFVINTCACAFVYVAHVNGFENSWVRDALERDELASADAADADDAAGVADVYVCALYWAAATVSTVGYGDVAATTRAERIAAVAVMTAGSTWFASLVGRVAALVERHGDASRRREAYREKMVALRCFLRRHPNVPRDLRLRLAVFFSDTWASQRKGLVMNDRALLAELPEALRSETGFRAPRWRRAPPLPTTATSRASPSARSARSWTRSSRGSSRGTRDSTCEARSRSCARARSRCVIATTHVVWEPRGNAAAAKTKASPRKVKSSPEARRARFSASPRFSAARRTARRRSRALAWSRRSPSPSARCTRWTPSAPARSGTRSRAAARRLARAGAAGRVTIVLREDS